MPSEKNQSSKRCARRETSTLKPLIHRPSQRKSSHDFTSCSQPLKSFNVLPKESYEYSQRNRPPRDSILLPPWYDGKLGSVESHVTQFAIMTQHNHVGLGSSVG